MALTAGEPATARAGTGIKTVGQACEFYSVDNNQFPAVGSLSSLEPAEGNLPPHLQPDYLTKCPTVDGWSHALYYGSDGAEYTVRSYGKDGALTAATGAKTKNFKDDIIFSNGAFLQAPEGQQQ